MNIHEFIGRWSRVKGVADTEATKLVQAYPDPEYNDPDRERKRSERWFATSNAHAAVTAACVTEGLSMFPDVPPWMRHTDDAELLVNTWQRAAQYASAEIPELTAEAYSPDRTQEIMRINAPAWFKNVEFIRWLNHAGTATWHTPGKPPGEYSDVFFTFCQGEGSDYPNCSSDCPAIPQEIWKHLEFMIADRFGWDAEVLVWVSNLED